MISIFLTDAPGFCTLQNCGSSLDTTTCQTCLLLTLQLRTLAILSHIPADEATIQSLYNSYITQPSLLERLLAPVSCFESADVCCFALASFPAYADELADVGTVAFGDSEYFVANGEAAAKLAFFPPAAVCTADPRCIYVSVCGLRQSEDNCSRFDPNNSAGCVAQPGCEVVTTAEGTAQCFTAGTTPCIGVGNGGSCPEHVVDTLGRGASGLSPGCAARGLCLARPLALAGVQLDECSVN